MYTCLNISQLLSLVAIITQFWLCCTVCTLLYLWFGAELIHFRDYMNQTTKCTQNIHVIFLHYVKKYCTQWQQVNKKSYLNNYLTSTHFLSNHEAYHDLLTSQDHLLTMLCVHAHFKRNFKKPSLYSENLTVVLTCCINFSLTWKSTLHCISLWDIYLEPLARNGLTPQSSNSIHWHKSPTTFSNSWHFLVTAKT